MRLRQKITSKGREICARRDSLFKERDEPISGTVQHPPKYKLTTSIYLTNYLIIITCPNHYKWFINTDIALTWKFNYCFNTLNIFVQEEIVFK